MQEFFPPTFKLIFIAVLRIFDNFGSVSHWVCPSSKTTFIHRFSLLSRLLWKKRESLNTGNGKKTSNRETKKTNTISIFFLLTYLVHIHASNRFPSNTFPPWSL
jgi:hypothetical protein